MRKTLFITAMLTFVGAGVIFDLGYIGTSLGVAFVGFSCILGLME